MRGYLHNESASERTPLRGLLVPGVNMEVHLDWISTEHGHILVRRAEHGLNMTGLSAPSRRIS